MYNGSFYPILGSGTLKVGNIKYVTSDTPVGFKTNHTLYASYVEQNVAADKTPPNVSSVSLSFGNGTAITASVVAEDDATGIAAYGYALSYDENCGNAAYIETANSSYTYAAITDRYVCVRVRDRNDILGDDL